MNKKVFIIEDDENIAELLQIIVQNEGYSVKLFSKLNRVENEMMKQKPCLIIMDLNLGSTDGSLYVGKFKKNKSISSIPIILVSARTSLREIASQVEADAYLAKPFDIKDLTTLIKQLT